jgi:preprotein translocase subunit SecA
MVSRQQILQQLLLLPQGARATYDRKTHRRMLQRTTRLTYIFHAARFLENREPDDIAEEVLEHLEDAQGAMRQAWGAAEWTRLSNFAPSALDERARLGLQNLLGDDRFAQVESQPLFNLPANEREAVVDELGRQALTEIYRQLLLGVITDLWVDYLTQMEALRVAIGLEAYAQRDPLVQYKSKAFGLFQELLGNMRLGVINRMFTYRPRDMATVQASVGRIESGEAEDGGAQAAEPLPSDGDQDGAIEEERMPEPQQAVAQPQPAGQANKPGGKKKRNRRR